jgi:hypothetical protein
VTPSSGQALPLASAGFAFHEVRPGVGAGRNPAPTPITGLAVAESAGTGYAPAMTRKFTDVPYEVVEGPRYRRDPLPTWFKIVMLLAATAFLIALGVTKMTEIHGPTAPPAEADGRVALPAPPAQ